MMCDSYPPAGAHDFFHHDIIMDGNLEEIAEMMAGYPHTR